MDMINRQTAIRWIKTECNPYGKPTLDYETSCRIMEHLDRMPSTQPKIGRWIKLDMHRGMANHKCTACEQECYVPTCMGEPMYEFCPNCGAKMEVEE